MPQREQVEIERLKRQIGATASAGLLAANNLSDVANNSTALANLGGISSVGGDSSPTLGGDLDANGSNITDVGAITFDTEVANIATTKSLDLETYVSFDLTMTANTTISFTNPPTTGNELVFSVELAGAFTPTWPGAVSWKGSTPTYAAGDLYVFRTVDGGTVWDGALIGVNAGITDVVDDTTPTLGGTLDADGNALENVGPVEEDVTTVATSGATETLDVSTVGAFDITMDQNCTFTFSNPAPSGDMSSFVLILRGAFTPTWPASVDWPDATEPTYTTPSVYSFLTVDAGTTWLGAQAGKAFG